MTNSYPPTKSIDGLQRRTRTMSATAAVAQPALPLRRFEKPVRRTDRKSWRMPEWLQLTLAIPVIMICSIFIQSSIFGQLAVVVYGIVAFIWRIPSRTSFTLALLSMIATTVLLVVRGDLPLSQNFATYTFLLLVVGVITLGRELKKEGGRIYSNRQR